MPRALVTGAAGFIGSHLVEALMARGWEVVAVDTAWIPSEILQRMPLGQSVGKVAEALVDSPHVTQNPPDVIFHLAARIGVGRILADPIAMLTEHAEDTLAVCRFAREHGAKLVITSSSEVYRSGVNLKEDAVLYIDPSTVARAGYAVTKLYGEHVALAYHRQRGLPVVIARLFNIAGPRQRAEGGCVVPIFCKAALSGEALQVHGAGGQRRAFTHVEDCVRALLALADEPQAVGEIVNVGCGTLRTTFEAASDIVNHARLRYGRATRIEYVDLKTLDAHAAVPAMEIRHGNFEKLQRLTGLTIPNRWATIVEEVCAEWAARIGVSAQEEQACG